MMPRWGELTEQDRAGLRTLVAFLDGRLEDSATIDWALRLKPNDNLKRLALSELIDGQRWRSIDEPWRTAWRLIEESWSVHPIDDHASNGEYSAQRRLRAGDRSGSLVTAIVQLVAPYLRVEPFSSLHRQYRTIPKTPKKVQDIFSLGLTSGRAIDPTILKIDELADRSFLLSLASALDAAVSNGLDIARRIGWDQEPRHWHPGQIRRVYYVSPAARADGEDEPDSFHRGIAPSLKLLHLVVARLVDVSISDAIEFIRRWKATKSPIHQRLWAALSRDSRVTSATEVANFLLSADDLSFWVVDEFPEIAELRAMRFSEMDPLQQAQVATRVRKTPPRNLWSRKLEPDRMRGIRLYSAVQELRRIEIGGGTLPKPDKEWLESAIGGFPELQQVFRLDKGVRGSSQAHWMPPNPDSQYDGLTGDERLKALENALRSGRRSWDDDPCENAGAWMRQPGNAVKVLGDLEYNTDRLGAFAKVWEQFGWTHSPSKAEGQVMIARDLMSECSRVLSLLGILPAPTISQAIGGISHWLYAWERQIVGLSATSKVWLKFWPAAVEATNSQQPVDEEVTLNAVSRSSDDQDPTDLDTLNTPAGKLVGVFLAACPTHAMNPNPFDAPSTLRTMRDAILGTTGRAQLIARHRMIEALPYFLRADPDWTHQQLIAPLILDNTEAIVLWRAIARQTQFGPVLAIIGDQMAERATDMRLSRNVRRSLVFSLVVEGLHAFREGREPAVSYVRIQQMLRSLDDEVRASAAEAVQRFVKDISAPRGEDQSPPSPEELFRTVAAPFIQKVWPQERSLATPGVSKAFADLPATTREAFAGAVDAIERFLVPFECWSMLDYGLYGEEGGVLNLSMINSHEKASAFLRLLDLTIGTAERSVVPYDLPDALDQVRRIAPMLAQNRAFLRLAALARRV